MKRLNVDLKNCIGCRICELACSMERFGVFHPERSRIRVIRSEPGIDVPVFCQQCNNPPCASVCPVSAVEKHDGRVSVDCSICVGCGRCVEACPFGAMTIDPVDGKALNCDECSGAPKCLEWCPVKVISYNLSPVHSPADTVRVKRSETALRMARSYLEWVKNFEE